MNWSYFHGNIKQFLETWNYTPELKDSLINGKIKIIMDEKKARLLENYLMIDNPSIYLINLSQKKLPLYQFRHRYYD
jgi:hypothetical protein